MAMAGLVADAEAWLSFVPDWDEALAEAPAIRYFKLSDAAGRPSGPFARFSSDQIRAKLIRLAEVINKHVDLCVYSVIDLEAHEQYWRDEMERPLNDPYFWAFHAMIQHLCFILWDQGESNRLSIMFDESKASGTHANAYYPFLSAALHAKLPQEASILPATINFDTDLNFKPLQAADLIAGCVRRGASEDLQFLWLQDHLPNLNWCQEPLVIDEDWILQSHHRQLHKQIQKTFSGLYPELLPPPFLAKKSSSGQSS
jgi:hypothetical protein